MAYPVLADNSSWFAPTISTIKRSTITEIEIMDSYTPDASVTTADSWDASAAKDGSIMCYVIGTKLIIAGNSSGMISMPTNSAQFFSYSSDWSDLFSELVTINGAHLLDFSSVTNLQFLFYDSQKLAFADVSAWDLSNNEYLGGVFYGCKAINNIDVSNWNVSNVSEIYSMFQDCSVLTSLDLSKWNLTKPISFRQMFYGCSSLTTVGDLSDWVITECSNMEAMFEKCIKLTSVQLGKFTMVSGTGNRPMESIFEDCADLEYFSIRKWQLNFDVSFSRMFAECKKIREVDLSCVDFSRVTDISFMFYGCSSLGEIDVSNWNVSKVTNFDHFAAHANLKRKGIENWKPISATNMNALFHNCAEEELDLSGWDVSKVQFFCQMFENSQNLKRIKGLEKWDTSAGLGFDGMFERCYKLEEVDLSSFNTTKAKNNVSGSTNGHTTATLQNMFLSCNNLKKVKLGPNFSINGDGTNTTAGNKLILPTPSTDYITGADGNWYAFNGDPYAPNAIPDRTADTYFASFPLCQNEDVIVKNGSLIDVAKAIKEKNGATDKYTPAQFGAAIRAL